ncbi:hypothetical protein HZC33_01165 [Candidatus Wolfebacteria bacterium]|nr:hypothetical protein [Candidatus Wolfebacteria bacterium]
MIQTVERSSCSRGFEHFHGGVGVQGILSDLVIPAIPGEYYAYSSEFTKERPLYALMKCKANKDRPITAAEDLGQEANLLFLFGNQNQVQACAIRTAYISGLLGDSVNGESFGETWIAPARITAEDFYELRSRKDVTKLVEICQVACSERRASIALEPGVVIAMMTDCGKYGLFFVRRITPALIQIDACHILL